MISRIKKYTFIMIISVLCSSLYAQVLTNSIIKTLRVKPVDNQRMYTGEDLKFELFIPYISSALVDATDPENTDTLTFVNMHKYSVQGEEDLPSGVRIELTLNFSKKGSYKPSPLIVRIRNIPYQIKFESFSVALNPQEQIPLVVIEFEDGSLFYSDSEKSLNPVFTGTTGEKIKFKLYLQYGIQLIQFNWDLPKDSIFKQLKAYEITEPKYREKIFSDALVPIADFEWIPLIPGTVDFPDFKFTVIAYNGNKYDLSTPSIRGMINEAAEYIEQQENDYLSEAFDFSSFDENSTAARVVTEAQCKELAELRCAEIRAITPAVKKQRAAYEDSLGLPAADAEFPVIIFYLSLIITLIFTFFLCIFVRKNSVKLNVFVIVLLIASLFVLINSIRLKSGSFAVTKGGALCSIPEDIAEKKTTISAGNRVQIVEKTGGWYYIQIGEIGGWCKEDNLILIK